MDVSSGGWLANQNRGANISIDSPAEHEARCAGELVAFPKGGFDRFASLLFVIFRLDRIPGATLS